LRRSTYKKKKLKEINLYQIHEKYAIKILFIFICNNILAEMKFPLSPAVNEIIFSLETQFIFLLPTSSMPKSFVDILIARNCTIPSLSLKDLSGGTHRAPYSTEGRGIMFLSYYTLLRLRPCFISGYALETQRLRDVGLSFAHDTRVLRINTRSLALPSVFGFSIDTWALWILDSGFAQISGHALIITPSSSTSPSIFGRCAFSDLVSLTHRIYSRLWLCP
jgi:hypothetical protein